MLSVVLYIGKGCKQVVNQIGQFLSLKVKPPSLSSDW